MNILCSKKVCVVTGGITALIFLLSFAGKRFNVDSLKPKEKLSDYQFFNGELKLLQPAENVMPYELNSALFSNYAEKLRFVYIPKEKQATYKEKGVFDFPEGTFLIKNFYYPFDFRHPEKGRRIIETRLLVLTNKGWEAWPYYWNEEQTEAFYNVAGEATEVSYVNISGKKIKASYHVPNKNECKGCHSYNQQMIPLGLSAASLNRDMQYGDISENQLLHWQKQGVLTALPEMNSIPKMPVWNDPASGSLNERARAYLDINCSNCHRRGGPAETSGLLLTYDEQNGTSIGINKTPVAAGRASAGMLYDIAPGKPNESILLHRMQTTDPGEAMPELGREQVHREAIELIAEWIREMKNVPAK